jgi:hypothetical protein
MANFLSKQRDNKNIFIYNALQYIISEDSNNVIQFWQTISQQREYRIKD